MIKSIVGYPKIILMVLVSVFYLQTLNFEFVYDDELIIVDHKHVQAGFSGLSKIWTTNMTNGVEAFNDGLYRPIPLTVHAVVVQLFGNNPFWGHLVNLLVYFFLLTLIFQLALRWLGKEYQTQALLITALFALHPIHVEVVANIKSLDELLALLFPLLGYCLAAKKGIEGIRKIAVLSLGLLLGLLSKESAITWVIVMPLLLLVDEEYELKKLGVTFLAFIGVSVSWYLLHHTIIQRMPSEVDKDLFSGLSNATLIPESWMDQKANGIWLTFNYLRQLFWPLPLVSDYSPESLKIISVNSWQFVVSSISLVTTFFISWRVRNTWPWMAMAIFSWFIFISPASNIFLSIGTTYAERLAFTPSLSLVFLAIALFKKLPESKVGYGLVGFMIFFGVLSMLRIPDWKSNVKLFEADIQKFPNNYKLHYNYGTHLVAQVSGGDVTDPEDIEIVKHAIEIYQRGIQLQPNHADAYNNLGNAYRRIMAFDQAVNTFNTLLDVNPNYLKAYYNRGMAYFLSQQYSNAQQDFIRFGREASHMNERGAAWYWAGVSSGHIGEFQTAINCLKKSIKINENSWDAWNFMGMAHGNLGEHQNALEAFKRAYELNPDQNVKQNLIQAEQAIKENQIRLSQ